MTKLLLGIAMAALVVVAVLGALVQLVRGQRPPLLGRTPLLAGA
jgi:hypothetical protein